MTVTIAIRYSVADLDVATGAARRAKSMWMKCGADDFRLSQIHTGPYTSQWLFSLVFADLAAYEKALQGVRSSDDLKIISAENAKAGNVMQQREVLLGIDL